MYELTDTQKVRVHVMYTENLCLELSHNMFPSFSIAIPITLVLLVSVMYRSGGPVMVVQ